MKSIWLEFPVKDMEKSKVFFRAIGFLEKIKRVKILPLAAFSLAIRIS